MLAQLSPAALLRMHAPPAPQVLLLVDGREQYSGKRGQGPASALEQHMTKVGCLHSMPRWRAVLYSAGTQFIPSLQPAALDAVA